MFSRGRSCMLVVAENAYAHYAVVSEWQQFSQNAKGYLVFARMTVLYTICSAKCCCPTHDQRSRCRSESIEKMTKEVRNHAGSSFMPHTAG